MTFRRWAVASAVVGMALGLGGSGCTKSEPSATAPTPSQAKAQAGVQEHDGDKPGEGLIDLPPSKSGSSYEVSMELPSAVTAGAPAELVVKLAAKDGFKLNAEYPHNFRPKNASPEVKFEKDRYELTAGAEQKPCTQDPKDSCEMRAKIPFQAAAGQHVRAAGVVAFSVCNPEQCLIEKVPLAVDVAVK